MIEKQEVVKMNLIEAVVFSKALKSLKKMSPKGIQ
jgi:hypothetical protein